MHELSNVCSLFNAGADIWKRAEVWDSLEVTVCGALEAAPIPENAISRPLVNNFFRGCGGLERNDYALARIDPVLTNAYHCPIAHALKAREKLVFARDDTPILPPYIVFQVSDGREEQLKKLDTGTKTNQGMGYLEYTAGIGRQVR